MNIVFLASAYYPHYSAVGRCVGNIVEGFPSDTNIHVIALKRSKHELLYEEYKNHKIIRIDTRDNSIRNALNEKTLASKGMVRSIYKITSSIYRIFRALCFVLATVSVDKALVTEFEGALKRIESKIDVIMPSSMPVEAVIAAVHYRLNVDNDVKVMPYLFDQFAESRTLHRMDINRFLKMHRHVSLERKVLSSAAHIFAMHSLKGHIDRCHPEVANVSYVEHPLITEPEIKNVSSVNGLKISYVGGLHRRYVSPDYLLDIFSKADIEGATLNFYVTGNNIQNVNRYCRLMPSRVINHGSVDKNTANEQMANSHVLISIAEIRGLQMSSKIFEYMSHGKPIIHFHRNNTDVSKQVLARYPLALCLKEDDSMFTENLTKFIEFCIANKNRRIEFGEVRRIFPEALPSYTIDLICEKLGRSHPHQISPQKLSQQHGQPESSSRWESHRASLP